MNNIWPHPAVIAPNKFVYKSLSCWSLNFAVGCLHACRFCYVPSASTNKLAEPLSKFGVTDPDEQWGEYALLRSWDEKAFLSSLRRAEETPVEKLNRDGNRAVMLCTTTDPYQTSADKAWNARRTELVRNALTLIRDKSTINVRILTRSPLARTDFDLMRTFGNRLLFGMSLPTLRNDLSRVYEPKAPAPTKRLETLRLAKEFGLHVYVAMAPTYPECDNVDIAHTLAAVKELDPVTVFHEPINIRAENVERIKKHADLLGVNVMADVFESPRRWREYAVSQLIEVERGANEIGLHQLHLWPDKSLGHFLSRERGTVSDETHSAWLWKWWNRVSEWPR